MGYGGFGLQKWIYKQKARKPFTNSRKSISENSSFSDKFNLATGSLDKEETLKRIKKRKIIDLLTIIVFISVLVSVSFFFASYFLKYEKELEQYELINIEGRALESYRILINSGQNYFEAENYVSAAYEFELAYKIKKEAKIKLKLIKCYNELCNNNNVYCTKLKNIYEN